MADPAHDFDQVFDDWFRRAGLPTQAEDMQNRHEWMVQEMFDRFMPDDGADLEVEIET